MPARDELYNRRTAPFQLRNVAGNNKEAAQKLLKQLRLFMEERPAPRNFMSYRVLAAGRQSGAPPKAA